MTQCFQVEISVERRIDISDGMKEILYRLTISKRQRDTEVAINTVAIVPLA